MFRRTRKAPEATRFDEVMALGGDALRELVAADPAAAAPYLEAAAKYGLVNAQLAWARMLLHGEGVRRDSEAAARWFAAAAGSGNAEAENMLGRCHEHGWGVEPSREAAVRHYEAAAGKGDVWGMYNLAQLLLAGNPDEDDQRRALDLHRTAAEAGHAKSMNVVGRFCEEGWHMPKDRGAAKGWYRKAAKGWYRKAAEGGDYWAQFNLGRMLLVGEGDVAAAAHWLGRAADEGNPEFAASIAPALLARPELEIRVIGERIEARISGRKVALSET
ncbi:tetratricopeptide repeat protein [Terrihabitans rhizophilus]|uniref:Tetratricopeptide repeat protein n=1 Tax=Terrihabitans rhizophilus TaxID=3092662 RepID=A0ABU4RQ68_9HYPH|nr:tetratricopeptide repeat protein [Terrihabitans sp. PJ23]MDX6806990.1 tetratricopeptide repeat protein [Terrihabitans sp. PJ23]